MKTSSTYSPLTKPSGDSCEHCGRKLTVISVQVLGANISLRPACECRLAEWEKLEKQARAAELHRMIRQQGLENGFYAGMTMGGWRDHDSASCAVREKLMVYLLGARLETRNWLYMHGGYGLGKTHLAVAALKYLCMDRQWKPLLIRWSEYCSRIQLSWHSAEAGNEYYLWRKAFEAKLLVIDDIDKRASSEWALGKLYELIDYRYMLQLPTIITANRNIKNLSAYWARNEQTQDLAEAIISRVIGQLSVVMEFSGRDYRLGAT